MTDNQGMYNDTYTSPATSILTFNAANWKDATKVKVTALGLKYGDESELHEPSYVIEQLDPDIGMGAAMEGSGIDADAMLITGDITPYRVTSRGFGATENAIKTLQTSYNRRYFQ
jgi:Tfp pilus assembly protein PilX